MYGSVQLVFEPKAPGLKPEESQKIQELLGSLSVESVIAVRGKVRERPAGYPFVFFFLNRFSRYDK